MTVADNDINEKENDDNNNSECKMLIEIINKLQTECTDLFDQIICDEAHKLKSDRMKTSCLINLININCLIFLMITLMINKPMNLTDVLALLWKENFWKESSKNIELLKYQKVKTQI